MGCLVVSGDVWWKFHSAGTLLCLPRELDLKAGIAFDYPHCTLGPLWVPLVPFSRWLWFHLSYLVHFLPPRYTKWTPRASSTPTRERTCTAFGPLCSRPDFGPCVEIVFVSPVLARSQRRGGFLHLMEDLAQRAGEEKKGHDWK